MVILTATKKLPAPVARIARPLLMLLAALGLAWLAFSLYAAGQPLVGLALLGFGAAAIVIYGSARSLAWKYLFPGVAAMLLFVAFPLLYTVQIGFTNYSSSNLLDEARARAYLLEQATVDEAQAWPFTLHAEPSAPGGWRLRLVPPEGAAGHAAGEHALITPPLDLSTLARIAPMLHAPPVALQAQGSTPLAPAATLREVIGQRASLMALRLQLPGGPAAGTAAEAGLLSYAGLREFGALTPLWRPALEGATEGALERTASGERYHPNPRTGFFENAAGERIAPGFKVHIGLANYSRMLLDAHVRGPFLSIFVWTVAFAGLTVLFAGGLGLALAVLLNWEGFKYRTLYRTLLFLPYAVPGFISILVFKGLFNQNFGEINALLDALFGVRPAWFADPLLAKAMLLIVNTWLGYPYFMVLCAGLIKAIPADLYEASAIAGAGPLTNFFQITVPLIVRPLTPLLISAFAFNFNNFVLVSLLTDGRPDFLNTQLPAGTTDILVSYTYRIAFTDSGQNFGLAAAISTLIFALVAVMALVQLKFTRAAAASARRA